MLEPFWEGLWINIRAPEEFNKVGGSVVRRALRREVERLETEIEQRLSKQQSKSLPGESDFAQTCVLPYSREGKSSHFSMCTIVAAPRLDEARAPWVKTKNVLGNPAVSAPSRSRANARRAPTPRNLARKSPLQRSLPPIRLRSQLIFRNSRRLWQMITAMSRRRF
jgi:hypothetical protein